MEPIRVLHILHSMDRGGAENAIMNYFRHIDRNKVQFDFLLTEPSKCQFEDEINSLGGRVYRVPQLTIKNPVPYLSGIWRFFKTHSTYRIVHSHTSSKSFFPLLIALLTGVPVRVCHSHNTKSEKGISGLFRDFLKVPLRLVSTHLCACGKDAAIWLYGARAVEKGKVTIVPNVIEANSFEYSEQTRSLVRKQLGIADSTIVIGCAARFSIQKNHHFLISVFNEIHKKIEDSKLILVGDGELRHAIYNQIVNLGISSDVIFTGVVPDVASYEQAMDCFVMTSLYEGLPLSLIEAQICGLKCFVSSGITRESDKTGLVTFIPLDKGAGFWADIIIDGIHYERYSRLSDIQRAGYDAESSSKVLETMYLDLFQSAKLK